MGQAGEDEGARQAVPAGRCSENTEKEERANEYLAPIPAGGAFGLFAVGLFWLAVELDNAELQAGKNPHSGFCPESPTP